MVFDGLGRKARQAGNVGGGAVADQVVAVAGGGEGEVGGGRVSTALGAAGDVERLVWREVQSEIAGKVARVAKALRAAGRTGAGGDAQDREALRHQDA